MPQAAAHASGSWSPGSPAVQAGGAAWGQVVPVAFDEHHLGGAGQFRRDGPGDVADDADGADLVAAVPGLAGAVQHRLVLPVVAVGGGVQGGLVVLEDQHPAQAEGVHRLDVFFLGVHGVGRQDDQLSFQFFSSFFFSSSSCCFCLLLRAARARGAAAAVAVLAAVAAVVAAPGAAVEDGLQEGDEAGDLVGLAVHLVLAQDGPGAHVVGGEQVRGLAAGVAGTAHGLAVDGDVPPVQPPGRCLGPEPGAQLPVGSFGVDLADGPLDRFLLAGPHVLPASRLLYRIPQRRSASCGIVAANCAAA